MQLHWVYVALPDCMWLCMTWRDSVWPYGTFVWPLAAEISNASWLSNDTRHTLLYTTVCGFSDSRLLQNKQLD